MRFYLDMVKHSLDYFKGEKVSSQAWFSPTPIAELLDVSKSGSLTTTKKIKKQRLF